MIAAPRGGWAGRRVLVTGHTGFKGAWLGFWLARLGARVVGLAAPPPTAPSFFSLCGVQADLEHRVGDVRDGGTVEAAFAAAEPQVVFHLAAQALVPEAARRPRETFEVNVLGTLRVLEAAVRTPSVEAVVVVTSDKCYRDVAAGRRQREGDPLGGAEPYSASKAAAELVAAVYGSPSFQATAGWRRLPVATARAGNVLGGGDYAADRLVPDLVRAAAAGVPLEVRSPAAVRPWQHVLDALHGYLALGAALVDGAVGGDAYNFGPGEAGEVPVRDLLARFADHWPELAWRPAAGAPVAVESPVLRLDTARARERLGWSPRWDLEHCVAATAQWYRRAAAGAGGDELRRLSGEQLDRFSAAVEGGAE